MAMRVTSVRPDMTLAIMEKTGLDEAMLDRLVRRFYAAVRTDPTLGPIFDDAIDDWEPHLQRMIAFWSSVALMTGRYRGQPVAKHLPLPVTRADFDRWLELFRQTACQVCSTAGAEHLILHAERIAASLNTAVEDHRARNGTGPTPPRLV